MVSRRWWIVKGDNPAFDWLNLMYWPYTLMFLSFGAIGFMIAPKQNWELLPLGVLVFFLGVGVLAHCLDELKGRPLGTNIPSHHLKLASLFSLVILGLVTISLTLSYSFFILPLFILSGSIVVVYNLELFSGRFHSDMIFIIGFGIMPQFIAYFVSGLVFPSLSVIIIMIALGSVCGVETVINHHIKAHSMDYRTAYDKSFSYLERGIWVVVFMPVFLALGLSLWRLGF